MFIEKADTMRTFDQKETKEAAKAFEDRAKKIEPYINIDNNNHEEMH